MVVIVTVDVVVVTDAVGNLLGAGVGREAGDVGGLAQQFPLWQQSPQYGALVPQ